LDFIQTFLLHNYVKLIIFLLTIKNRRWDKLSGITLGYGLDDPGFESRQGLNSFLRHSVQTGFGVYPASYPMGTRGSFPGGKAAGA
jgi:hypothetical protein